jgi:hypothetical protein
VFQACIAARCIATDLLQRPSCAVPSRRGTPGVLFGGPSPAPAPAPAPAWHTLQGLPPASCARTRRRRSAACATRRDGWLAAVDGEGRGDQAERVGGLGGVVAAVLARAARRRGQGAAPRAPARPPARPPAVHRDDRMENAGDACDAPTQQQPQCLAEASARRRRRMDAGGFRRGRRLRGRASALIKANAALVLRAASLYSAPRPRAARRGTRVVLAGLPGHCSLQLAVEGYQAFVRSYATHARSTKHIFSVHALHLGESRRRPHARACARARARIVAPFTHTHTHTRARTRIHRCTRTQMHVHTHAHARTHPRTHARTRADAHADTHTHTQ